MQRIVRPILGIGLLGIAGCYEGLGARDDGDTAESNDAGDAEATASGGEGGDETGEEPDPLISECRRPSLEVFERLAPSCVGCHDEGTNVPLAADFVSFERLVAYNEDLVTPGRPEDSVLLRMLTGDAPPPLDQMPPGAVSFAELAELGATEISMEELEAWIADLEPCAAPDGGLSPRFARRVTAEQIQRSLLQQLGLTPDDVYYVERFPLDDPTFGDLTTAHNSSGNAWARWAALGGPDLIRGNARTSEMGPLFFQTLGPMAQAWCRRSIEVESGALFEHASPDSDSTQDEAAIRDNIRWLFLALLGVEASERDVDGMYTGVYLPYEAADGPRTAWTAVCAAFVRDPLWVTF